jgi:hypothetical protein
VVRWHPVAHGFSRWRRAPSAARGERFGDRRCLVLPVIRTTSRIFGTIFFSPLSAMISSKIYGVGDGNEFGWRNRGRSPPKFHAAYSSSALQVNTFAPFRSRIGDLVLFGASRFASLRFEAQLATGLARSPNIDVLCEGGDVVAIESKCLEFLYPGAAKDARRKASQPPFRPSYAAIEHHLDSNFRQLYDEIRGDPGIFAPVDAAQLVKHCFGLRMAYGRRPIILAYLFWEPSDSNRYAVFAQHRHQIARVAEILSGSSVSFAAMSYAELFQTWLDASAPQWLADHIAKLRQRYDVPLMPASACGGGRI